MSVDRIQKAYRFGKSTSISIPPGLFKLEWGTQNVTFTFNLLTDLLKMPVFRNNGTTSSHRNLYFN